MQFMSKFMVLGAFALALQADAFSNKKELGGAGEPPSGLENELGGAGEPPSGPRGASHGARSRHTSLQIRSVTTCWRGHVLCVCFFCVWPTIFLSVALTLNTLHATCWSSVRRIIGNLVILTDSVVGLPLFALHPAIRSAGV